MTDRPEVSVIVPVFNGEERLVQSVESILNQTLKSIEIILVNDASTDGTKELINRLASDHANIVPIHFSENKGVHEARLAGLRKSIAPWIGFLDADDFARPPMYAALLSAAIEHDADIVVCGSDRVNERRKVIAPKLKFRRSEKVEEGIFKRFCAFGFGTGVLWNKLFRREVIEPWFDMRLPWRQNINEDLILNVGCFYCAKSVYILAETLHEYVYHGDSVTVRYSSSKAYVDTFRAFASALFVYRDIDNESMVDLLGMYREQISWPDYYVNDVGGLGSYRAELVEAERLVLEVCPGALAVLASRGTVDSLSARSAIRLLQRKISKKILRLN